MNTKINGNPKVALVTGAGSGIGKAVSIALMRNGYQVVLAGRRIELLQKSIAEAGTGVGRAVSVDITDPDAVNYLYSTIKAGFGRLDLLFNNAGVSGMDMPFQDIQYPDWQSIVNVNLNGAFLCAQGAFRMMLSQEPKGGRIINNGSIAAHSPRPNSAPYSSTKHALSGLTKSIALDGRRHNIACGQIDVGNAMTSLSAPMSKGVRQANGEFASEPMISVEEVASAVLHMDSFSLTTNVQSLTVIATGMPFVGRG